MEGSVLSSVLLDLEGEMESRKFEREREQLSFSDSDA